MWLIILRYIFTGILGFAQSFLISYNTETAAELSMLSLTLNWPSLPGELYSLRKGQDGFFYIDFKPQEKKEDQTNKLITCCGNFPHIGFLSSIHCLQDDVITSDKDPKEFHEALEARTLSELFYHEPQSYMDKDVK